MASRMRYDKEADPFYATPAWRKLRRLALDRDHGKCVECVREYREGGVPRPRDATTVHHIIPRTERPDLELQLDNLMSLCDEHHAQKHPEKGMTGKDRKAPSGGMKIYKL